MSRWEIKVPVSSPYDTVFDVAANARVLDSAEDKAVTRQLALECAAVGIKSARQMTMGLEDLTVDERRRLLDYVRAKCGFKTATDIESEREMDARCAAARYDQRNMDITRFDPSGGGFATVDVAEENRQRAQAETRRVEAEVRQQEAAAAAERHRPTEIKPDNLL